MSIQEFIFDAVTRAVSSTLGLFAPGYAATYARNRHLLKAVSLRAYTAAQSTGPNQLWRPGSSSAAREVSTAWAAVTNRARDLERNNPYVNGLVKVFCQNTVGAGQWPKSKVTNAAGELDVALNAEIETRWERFEPIACANGDSFTALQQQAARHLTIDGEFLVRKVSLPGQPLALQLLEADFLDTSKDQPSINGGGRCIGGIELDRWDRPRFYHLFTAHPGDGVSSSIKVPASEILHVFIRERSSQVRGLCHFASIVEELYDLNDFQRSMNTLARLGTAFGIFIESPTPQDYMPPANAGTDPGGTPERYVSPGGLHTLLPGEKIAQVKPDNPGANYSDFIRSRLRGASAGSMCSYETLSRDYSQSNYASSRLSAISERALYRTFSSLIEDRLYMPVYKWFLDNETTLAMPGVKPLRLPDYDKNPRKYLAVRWSRPRQEWVDPTKEANAASMRLSMGIDSLTSMAEAEGVDIEEVFKTRAAEIKRMKELGIFGIDPIVDQTTSQSTSVSQVIQPEKDDKAPNNEDESDAEEEIAGNTTAIGENANGTD